MKLLFLLLPVFCTLGLVTLRADNLPGLSEPIKTVTEKYLFIQQKLASDSFDGVTAAAVEIKAAIAAGKTKPFGDDFAKAVDGLASAKDINAARGAFQQVSSGLIATLALNKSQTGVLHVAFCPMVKANWVQTDGTVIHNPYFGASMSDCGLFKQQY